MNSYKNFKKIIDKANLMYSSNLDKFINLQHKYYKLNINTYTYKQQINKNKVNNTNDNDQTYTSFTSYGNNLVIAHKFKNLRNSVTNVDLFTQRYVQNY